MNSLRRKSRSWDRLEGSDSKEQINPTSELEGSSGIGTAVGLYLERVAAAAAAAAGIRRSQERQEKLVRAFDLEIRGDFLATVLRVLELGLEEKRRGE